MDGKPNPENQPQEQPQEVGKPKGNPVPSTRGVGRAEGFQRAEPEVNPKVETKTEKLPLRTRFSSLLRVVGIAMPVAIGLSGWLMLNHWDAPSDIPTPIIETGMLDHPHMGGEIVINLVDSVTEKQITELEAEFGLSLELNSPHSEETKLMIGRSELAGPELEALIKRIRESDLVETAEPQYIYESFAPPAGFPNDPHYPQQWNMKMIGMDVAWQFATGEGAIVAVIDSGVMIEDLGQSIQLSDFATTRRVPGHDFVEDDADPQDYEGHGSHVAGTIAQSTNNGEGVAGVAFDSTIMPIRALGNDGRGRLTDIAESVRWASNQGAHIINMSLGGGGPSKEIEDAIIFASQRGALVICAAGNEGVNPVAYPAAFPSAMAVSAVGPTGALASYSNYGAEIEIAAPGGFGTPGLNPKEIFDWAKNWLTGSPTKIVQQTVDVRQSSSGQIFKKPIYSELVGTSMACPHVSGVAALLFSMGVTDSAEIRNIIKKSAKPNADTMRFGAGILDAAEAVKLARNSVGAGILNNAGGVLLVFAGVFAGLTKGTGTVLNILRSHGKAIFLLALGLFLPSLVTMAFGVDSYLNLLGHGAVLPVLYVYVLKPEESLLKGLRFFVIGLAIHLFIDLQLNASPFPVIETGKLKLWMIVSLVACAYLLITARPEPTAETVTPVQPNPAV